MKRDAADSHGSPKNPVSYVLLPQLLDAVDTELAAGSNMTGFCVDFEIINNDLDGTYLALIKAAIGAVLLDRLTARTTLDGFWIEPVVGRMLGYAVQTDDPTSDSTALGEVVAAISEPIEVDGRWHALRCGSGVVPSAESGSRNGEDLFELCSLTAAETSDGIEVMIYSPYLSRRKADASKLANTVREAVADGMVGRSRRAILGGQTGTITGESLRCVVGLDDQDHDHNSVLRLSGGHHISYQLAESLLDAASGRQSNESGPITWYSFNAHQLANPSVFNQVVKLGELTGVGIELDGCGDLAAVRHWSRLLGSHNLAVSVSVGFADVWASANLGSLTNLRVERNVWEQSMASEKQQNELGVLLGRLKDQGITTTACDVDSGEQERELARIGFDYVAKPWRAKRSNQKAKTSPDSISSDI